LSFTYLKVGDLLWSAISDAKLADLQAVRWVHKRWGWRCQVSIGVKRRDTAASWTDVVGDHLDFLLILRFGFVNFGDRGWKCRLRYVRLRVMIFKRWRYR